MKSIKKILFSFTTVLLAVVLAACSTSGGSSSSSSSSSTPSVQDAMNKYTEAAKNIKSVKFTSDLNLKVTSGSESQEVSMKMNGTLASDPIALLADTEVKVGSQSNKISMYLKDNKLYGKLDGSSKWQEMPQSASFQKQLDSMKNVAGDDKVLDYYKNNASDFKIEEQGDNYALTYSGNDAKFIELLKETAKSTGSDSDFDDINLKNVNVKIVVKKSDFSPVESNLSIEFSQKDHDENTAKMDVKYTFSDINSATVTAPEGI